MQNWILGVLVVGLLIVTALTTCQPQPMEGSDPIVLKTYAVDRDNADHVQSVLEQMLVPGREGKIGRAQIIGEGLVAVTAPVSFHGGIQGLVREISRESLPPPARVRMHYWLVSATASDQSRADPSLASLDGALQGVSESLGPQRFELVDYVQHAVRSGTRSTVTGSLLEGRTTVAVRGERVAADVRLRAVAEAHGFESELDFQAGETIVLATTGRNQSQGSTLVFIVRAELF